ncbi:Protein of unknown function [Gryllus bimaculatus]|nr:Protein of unknown function [Gryllus bimaculatus]
MKHHYPKESPHYFLNRQEYTGYWKLTLIAYEEYNIEDVRRYYIFRIIFLYFYKIKSLNIDTILSIAILICIYIIWMN